MRAGPTFPRILVTAGEPAGIGPDIVVQALRESHDAAISVIGDCRVLHERASLLGLEVEIEPQRQSGPLERHQAGKIRVIDIPVSRAVEPGKPDPANAQAVLRSINMAVDFCLQNRADAIVTAPVSKAILHSSGTAFSGHTEWIAQRSGGGLPVMMLAGPDLRVCLATTHMPLASVPAAITCEHLVRVLEIISHDIERLYRIKHPAIGVLGLNPHAGESGYLGREEVDTIIPAMEFLRLRGMNLVGPLPADTAFTPNVRSGLDAVLAMYHDQGLPVIKFQGFGEVVNVTLGLPLIRTSVDHGTAFDLAGSGQAHADSLVAAIRMAIAFAGNAPTDKE